MKNGFTIIELMISMFILAIAIVGIFSAFSIVVIMTSDASNRLTATYLAQEGMEIVRNIRDNNWIKIYEGGTETWDNGLTNCETGCEADYKAPSDPSLFLKPYSPQDYLYKDNAGFYSYNYSDPDTKTIFQRKIIITKLPDFNQENCSSEQCHILKVTVQVSWDQKATILNEQHLASDCENSNCITTEETLYDWFNYE